MKLYLPITVDLYNIYPLRVLNLQQNNIGRGALITLTAAGTVIIPDSESLYVYAQKQDGTVVYNTCTLKDNQIQVDFDEQMTVESGILQVELQMVDTSGNSITTPIFQVNVQKSNIDYKKITSQDSFQALVTTLAEVQELKKTGLKGDPGEAATIQIGTVTASEAGSAPAITNRGTAQEAIFDFVLPRGEQGPRGQAGPADATDVAYNNSTSGLKATDTQAAIDELKTETTNLTENSKWKLFGSRTGSNRLGIKELVDAGREIKVVVEAQYSSVGERTKFVFYLLPSEDIKGIYSSGYCFSSTNYASVSISVSSDLSVLIMPSWWKMVENASNSVALNDTTATLKVYYR